MVVTVDGIVTLVTPPQPEKALEAMVVTGIKSPLEVNLIVIIL